MTTEQGLPVEIYAADRGYDDTENHYLLETKGMHSAIILNDYRTQKKDKNKEVWIKLEKTPEYEAGKRERYKIERKFGEGKENHGLRRCRSVGALKVRHPSLPHSTRIESETSGEAADRGELQGTRQGDGLGPRRRVPQQAWKRQTARSRARNGLHSAVHVH